ncbi:MAG: hypothetical protein AAGE84_30410 [Cyanobacteria bacterium P01_G01_bin.39]
MSPRKLTEDDKQEILQQYRNSEATTSTLAQSFEVSSSTISRFLKNNLSSVEYEDLIQQKRLARTPRGEKSSSKRTAHGGEPSSPPVSSASSSSKKSQSKTKRRKSSKATNHEDAMPELATAENLQLELATQSSTTESEITTPRRRRRRSAGSQSESSPPENEIMALEVDETIEAESIEEPTPAKLVLDHKFPNKNDADDVPRSERLILKSDRADLEDEEEEDSMDMMTLKEMLGEDLEDINDEDDDEDDDEWEDDDTLSYSSSKSELSDLEILPLSQASLPRTCYLVIDRAAELIVKPLADFADLGIIPDTEVQQSTLPVFDNHRIAKRFSHRRERVIKVPDGRMLQKTSQHLQDKGITRLLIDGQIYSLSN